MGQAASRQEAFWEACGFGHTDRVRKFLEEGDIDVNWVSYTHDCCPIHVASQGKPDIVRMLLEKGAKVNVKDVRDNLPIHHAAMKGHTEVVQILIDAGSEINTQDKNGWTALHCAAYWNKPDVVKCLLKNEADVNIENKDKRSALHETARSQEKGDFELGEIAQRLIEAGSDVNAKSSDLGEADFTGLMFASYHNHPEVASALISAGCEINAFGTNRWTALHWACDRGNDEMVFLLLEAGIDPTIRGWRNELASDRCQDNGIKEMVMNAVNMFEELSLLDRKVSLGDKSEDVSKTSMETSQEKQSTGNISAERTVGRGASQKALHNDTANKSCNISPDSESKDTVTDNVKLKGNPQSEDKDTVIIKSESETCVKQLEGVSSPGEDDSEQEKMDEVKQIDTQTTCDKSPEDTS